MGGNLALHILFTNEYVPQSRPEVITEALASDIGDDPLVYR